MLLRIFRRRQRGGRSLQTIPSEVFPHDDEAIFHFF